MNKNRKGLSSLKSTSGSGSAGADIIFQVGSNGGTEAMRILNSGNVGVGTANPSSKFELVNGSFSVTASSGIGGGISASTYTVKGASIFGTTWAVGDMDGYVIRYSSKIVPANTTITFSATEFSASAIGRSVCSQVELVNTAANTVRKKSNSGLPSSFTVYNADLTQNQEVECFVWVKPN